MFLTLISRPPRRLRGARAAWLCVLLAGANQALAQPPEDGGLVHSMGHPPKLAPFAGASLGLFSDEEQDDVAAYATFGIYKDLVNPALKVVGFSLEGYAGGRGGEADGGVRAIIRSPVLRIGAGIDYNLRDSSWHGIVSFSHPLRRGGILGGGSEFRFDWISGRGAGSFNFGVTLPLFQPHIDKTRPRKDHVSIPRYRLRGPQYNPDPSVTEAMDDAREAADWLRKLTTPFIDHRAITSGGVREAFEQRVAEIRGHLEGGATAEGDARRYHRAIERAFDAAAPGEGERIAGVARRILLDAVLFPYNQLLGQSKKKDSTTVYSVQALGHFETWVERESGLPASRREGVTFVFRELLDLVEEVRARSRKAWGESQTVWLPLQLALRPEDHDSREELDDLLERATGARFHDGNRIWYIVNEQFQQEVLRSIHAAEDYHVIWIHDIEAQNYAGEPDKVTFLQVVVGYLDAMTKRVLAYDETGRLPVYMIFQDQIFYEMKKSRAVLEVLERPLDDTDPGFPDDFAWMASTLESARARLRDAVASSARLQREGETYGRDWLQNRVKVHVSITNPADVSFFNWRMLPIIGSADTMIRDHRKIVFYDVTENDPYRGKALYSGMGIGEHYAGAAWEDRGILVEGPALLELKHRARELLLRQGWRDEQIPHPLRPRPKPASYEAMVEERTETLGLRASRGMDLHNQKRVRHEAGLGGQSRSLQPHAQGLDDRDSRSSVDGAHVGVDATGIEPSGRARLRDQPVDVVAPRRRQSSDHGQDL